MAVARNLLRRQDVELPRVAERAGFSSASAFDVTFRRHVGSATSSVQVPCRGQGRALDRCEMQPRRGRLRTQTPRESTDQPLHWSRRRCHRMLYAAQR
jgi:hypothetical protein